MLQRALAVCSYSDIYCDKIVIFMNLLLAGNIYSSNINVL